MTPSRPYLLRAVHQWLVDNGLTPQLVVDTSGEGVMVPSGFAHDGRIVLNVAPNAVRGLDLGNQWVEFDARFGGRPYHVRVPIAAVIAIAARENGAGLSFPDEEEGGIETGDDPGPPQSPPPRSGLRLVK